MHGNQTVSRPVYFYTHCRVLLDGQSDSLYSLSYFSRIFCLLAFFLTFLYSVCAWSAAIFTICLSPILEFLLFPLPSDLRPIYSLFHRSWFTLCTMMCLGVPVLLSVIHRLVGLVVRHPPRERKIPGPNPTCAGIFSG